MVGSSSISRVVLIVALVFACAAGGGVWWLLSREYPDPGPDTRETSFRERAAEAGIDFRMAFLPGEQGENFKINLYDHGCGVAVGDFNGDGHDDVYFLNQLGK